MRHINKIKNKYLIIFVFSIFLVFLSFYFRDALSSLGNFGLVGIFLVNLFSSATLFLPAPGIATVVAGGILFNPLIVALVAALGSAIGDMVGYFLGKSGKEVFFKKDSFWYQVFEETFNKFGWLFIILFSFIPNPVFDAVGIIAGVFSYNPKRFFIYIFIGRFLRNLVLAFFGSLF